MRVVGLILFAFFVALLAGCGVDGEPEQPQDDSVETGITVSGRAAVGVTF